MPSKVSKTWRWPVGGHPTGPCLRSRGIPACLALPSLHSCLPGSGVVGLSACLALVLPGFGFRSGFPSRFPSRFKSRFNRVSNPVQYLCHRFSSQVFCHVLNQVFFMFYFMFFHVLFSSFFNVFVLCFLTVLCHLIFMF